ncbi:MAG: competence/damage-inducible protein A [Candidatus Dormibacteria bacterium]
MPDLPARTASAVIAVGDELLLGFTLDTNSHWLAGRLRELGRPLCRVVQVPDRPARIRAELELVRDDPEVAVVFVCGGLGPTPDDRTLGAVAAFLGRPLRTDPGVLDMVKRSVARLHQRGLVDSPEPGAGMLKLADLPENPDAILHNPAGSCPGLLYRVARPAGDLSVFVLPGVPAELKAIFEQVLAPAHLGGGHAPHVAQHVFPMAVEASFFEVLRQVEVEFPEVTVGSYPQRETREVIIRVVSPDPERARAALDEVVRRMTPA